MIKQNKQKMKENCCFNNIDKAIRLGRANYACTNCGRDVSLLWFLYKEYKLKQSKLN